MSGLRRSLRLRDLVIMGIILVQPTAPMPLFGVVQQTAHGHVVTAILIAMLAMLLTAVSYGRMARVYPSAGSAYTYVGAEFHPVAGFVTGWSMLMDYVLNPLICTIWCSKAAQNILPGTPYAAWVVFFAGLFTWLNLRRIHTTARVNAALAAAMGVVIAATLIAVVRFVWTLPHVDASLFLRPFYDPQTFSLRSVAAGTSIAVLTYIGFDGISTLSEEVEDPRRNIPIATILICLVTGILSAVEVYAAQLVWPAGEAFPDVDTAYVHVAGRAGGMLLFQAVNLTLLVASIGSGGGGQLAGARLLYGMGRAGSLPGFFAQINEKTGIPAGNVILIGVLCVVGGLAMDYQLGAEMLNFGAFIGFMGVNAAAFRRGESALQKFWPLLGFAICLVMWISLNVPAKVGGTVWLVLGLAYGAYKTNGFRSAIRFDFPAE